MRVIATILFSLALSVTVFGQRTASEPPVRVTSADNRPTKTVKPVYPEEAKKAGIGGVVVLEVVIGKDGSVESTRSLKGPRQLVASAKEAVEQWRWEPFLLNGKPIRVATRVSVSFELQK